MVLDLPFITDLPRAVRDNTIDIYISEEADDVRGDDVWRKFFTEQPKKLSYEQKREYLAKIEGVSLGSDAFFPFGDNIIRARRSGVTYVAQPGGSVRDDDVINACNSSNMVMAFTGMRLFHH